MTLLLKKDVHPKLFKTPRIKHTSNQSTHRRNYMSEFLQEQKSFNKQLLDSFEQVSLDLRDSKVEHGSQLATVLIKLIKQEELHQQSLESIKNQETPIHNIVEKLNQVDKKSEALAKNIEMEGLINQAIMDELTSQNQTNHRVIRKLDDYETTYQELIVQEKKQSDLYEEISTSLKMQEAFHETLLKEIDQQQVLAQKTSKQIDSLKNAILEKITPIAEKIEPFIKKFSFLNEKKGEIKEEEKVTREEYLG
jgi:hypothetical protein